MIDQTTPHGGSPGEPVEALLTALHVPPASAKDPAAEELTADIAVEDLVQNHMAVVRNVETSGAVDPPGYRITDKLAEGGMGIVYAADDLTLGREVAIKVLKPGQYAARAAATARFASEARITGRLEHPGIPAVHALGLLPDDGPFLAMKLVRGKTLTDLLAERASLTQNLPWFLNVFEQICQAIGYAHSQGIVHRDLKPSNVMVGAFGEVQVMDWGLAKDQSAGTEGDFLPGSSDTARSPIETPEPVETAAGTVLGTPAFMAPEQARGGFADASADVFALGGLLCSILTGEPTFAAANAAEAVRWSAAGNLSETYARLERCGADAELVRVACLCLAADPADRPANGKAVADAIAVYRTGVDARLRTAERERAAAEATAAEAVNTRFAADARNREQRKRRQFQIALAGALGLLVLVGVGFGWWTEHTASQEQARRAADDADRQQAELTLRTTQQVESHQAAVRLAMQRGDIMAAIELFEHATAAGLPVTSEMRLSKARSLGHLMKHNEALAELAKLDVANSTPELRAQNDLLTGSLLLGTSEEPRGISLIQRAIDSGRLPVEEIDYARGLVATTIAEGLIHFRAALAKDPGHLEARGHLVISLNAIGRYEETIRLCEESQVIAPRHPIFPLILALAHATIEHPTEAKRRLAEVRTAFSSPADFELMSKLVAVLPMLRVSFRAALGVGPPPSDLSGMMFLTFQLPTVIDRQTKSGESMLGLRVTPAVRLGMQIILAELANFCLKSGGRPFPILARLGGDVKPVMVFTDAAGEAVARERLNGFPEGTLAYFFAWSKLGQGQKAQREKQADWRDQLAVAAASFADAAQMSGIFGLESTAHDLAISNYVIAGMESPCRPARPEYTKKAVELVRERRRNPNAGPPSSWIAYFAAARDANAGGLAADIMDDWRQATPTDGFIGSQQCWLDYLNGFYIRALSGAEKHNITELRDLCREQLGLLPIAPMPRIAK